MMPNADYDVVGQRRIVPNKSTRSILTRNSLVYCDM